MKAKEFVPASKPRNFVAKNAQTSGAGKHRDSDKKKDMEQGKVKHKKDLIPMEDVAEAASAAVRMQRAADRQRAKSDASLARTPSSIPKKQEPKKKDVSERVRDPEDWDEGNTEPPNNFAVYINGKKWKVFKGRGQFAGDYKEIQHHRQLQNWAQAKSAATGKEWKVYVTGETATESVSEAPSALEKFRKAADEREKKHDAAEKEMKARHASGKEDMKGSIDRLEKHLNNK
jgi:hypothetical protein